MRSRCVVLAWALPIVLAAAAARASEPAKTAAPAKAATPAVNVIAQGVRAISADSDAADTARLLVLVVDDAGDPLDGVAISVLAGGKEIASGESDARGRVLLRVAFAGPVVVRGVEAGLVPSEAHGVVLRKAGLTAVALPLEDAGRPAK